MTLCVRQKSIKARNASTERGTLPRTCSSAWIFASKGASESKEGPLKVSFNGEKQKSLSDLLAPGRKTKKKTLKKKIKSTRCGCYKLDETSRAASQEYDFHIYSV